MKEYMAYAQITARKYLGTVVAESEEDAIEKAWKTASVSVCHQCSREIEDPEVTEVEVEVK